MTEDEHREEQHKLLHSMLDELAADYLVHVARGTSFKGPSNTTVRELMEWSHQQTIQPTPPNVEDDRL